MGGAIFLFLGGKNLCSTTPSLDVTQRTLQLLRRQSMETARLGAENKSQCLHALIAHNKMSFPRQQLMPFLKLINKYFALFKPNWDIEDRTRHLLLFRVK